MELISGSLIIGEDYQDTAVCSGAYLAHSPIRPMRAFSNGEMLDQEETNKVLRGLAKICLGEYGIDYHGIKQAQADYIIGELSGSVEDFFEPKLCRDNN